MFDCLIHEFSRLMLKSPRLIDKAACLMRLSIIKTVKIYVSQNPLQRDNHLALRYRYFLPTHDLKK